jgi:hypothetical protein
MFAMFLIYAGTTWMTLYAGLRIAACCFASRKSSVGAVVLLALTLTMPIAGTSLMMMDPYVTARSFSTPCGLLAIAAVLELVAAFRERRKFSVSTAVTGMFGLVVAALMHPLMGAYTLACIVILICLCIHRASLRFAVILGLCSFAFGIAAAMESLAHVQSPDYALVAHTRTYWFLSRWTWYEMMGLFGPILTLFALHRRTANSLPVAKPYGELISKIAWMCAITGTIAVIIAACFAHQNSRSFLVARCQPLRVYLDIYVLMVLALGAFLATHVLKAHTWRWIMLGAMLAPSMAWVQHATFPASDHIELPWVAPRNGWEQAFRWISANTPPSAVFAMDARYTQAAGEDSQNFRAIAERSSLPDYEKDGGVASISPDFTSQWLIGQEAQANLNEANEDGVRQLKAYGVTWVVLPAHAPALRNCAYRNDAVKVCELPQASDVSEPVARPVAFRLR